jgi:hypothetical protein
VRTSWYCGIILSLFSILSAADQTVRLHRLSAHRDGLDNIRRLLAKSNGERSRSAKTGRQKPSLLQIMTWQMPVMFLTTATISMIVGMFLHVWSASTHLHAPMLWDDHTKVGCCKVIVLWYANVSLAGCRHFQYRCYRLPHHIFPWTDHSLLYSQTLMFHSSLQCMFLTQMS